MNSNIEMLLTNFRHKCNYKGIYTIIKNYVTYNYTSMNTRVYLQT